MEPFDISCSGVCLVCSTAQTKRKQHKQHKEKSGHWHHGDNMVSGNDGRNSTTSLSISMTGPRCAKRNPTQAKEVQTSATFWNKSNGTQRCIAQHTTKLLSTSKSNSVANAAVHAAWRKLNTDHKETGTAVMPSWRGTLLLVDLQIDSWLLCTPHT